MADSSLDLLRELLPRCASAEGALRRVSPDDLTGAVALGLHGELVGNLGLTGTSGGSIAGSELCTFLYTGIGQPSMRLQVARLARHQQAMIAAAREPYPMGVPRAKELEREIEAAGGWLIRIVLTRDASMLEREASYATQLDLARLAARCYDFRSKEGRFPGRLDELPGPAVADPRTSQSFIIAVEDGKHVLRGGEDARWPLEE